VQPVSVTFPPLKIPPPLHTTASVGAMRLPVMVQEMKVTVVAVSAQAPPPWHWRPGADRLLSLIVQFVSVAAEAIKRPPPALFPPLVLVTLLLSNCVLVRVGLPVPAVATPPPRACPLVACTVLPRMSQFSRCGLPLLMKTAPPVASPLLWVAVLFI